MKKCCQQNVKDIFKILNQYEDLLWEQEAEREVQGKNFINPADLERVSNFTQRISTEISNRIRN